MSNNEAALVPTTEDAPLQTLAAQINAHVSSKITAQSSNASQSPPVGSVKSPL